MATYVFVAKDGDRIEVEGSMKSPPRFGSTKRRGGKVYRRAIETAPVYVPPNIRSRSHQLPTWYGFNDSAAAKTLAANRREKVTDRHRWVIGKRNAERAGALADFDKRGRAVADTKTGISKHIKRGRNMGDTLAWD